MIPQTPQGRNHPKQLKSRPPDTLLRQVESGRSLLFVGAGLSRVGKDQKGNPLPTWPELLYQLAAACVSNGLFSNDEKHVVSNLVETKRYLAAATQIQSELGQPRFAQVLRGVFDGAESGAIHSAISTIPFFAIATTNFDHLLERGFAEPARCISVTRQEVTPDLFQSDKRVIIKLHGDYTKPESIILDAKSFGLCKPRGRQP